MNHEQNDIQWWLADDPTQAWMERHLPELRRTASGQRMLYTSLVFAAVVGLAAHVGGYALLSSFTSGLLGLLADLLHAFGWSLWTGAVVAVFVQVMPEVKRRQIRQALKDYQAQRHKKAQAGGNRHEAGRQQAEKRD